MIELDNAVKAEMVRIVKRFIDIRAELEESDRQVNALLEKNRQLDAERKALQLEEEKLFETIRLAYGPGKLNLRNLQWVPEDSKTLHESTSL